VHAPTGMCVYVRDWCVCVCVRARARTSLAFEVKGVFGFPVIHLRILLRKRVRADVSVNSVKLDWRNKIICFTCSFQLSISAQ
jgi:hypothetical protein